MTRTGDSSAIATADAEPPAQAYEFAGFLMDLRRVGVWKEGEGVPLEPKAFDVLRYLIEHRHRLVTKEELLEAVWKDTFVTPNALTRAIARLRKALADDAPPGTLIQTVARRGYRFVAPVSVTVSSEPPPVAAVPLTARRAGRTRTLVLGVTLAVVVAAGLWALWPARLPGAGPARSITPLTTSGNVVHAAVTPAGDMFVYAEIDGGQQSLWVRQIDAANAIQLVPPAPVEYWGVTVSPDARSVYYVVKGAAPHAHPSGSLFRIALLGGVPVPLGNGFDSAVAISPERQSLAFLRSGHPTSESSAVMIANMDGTGARAVAVRRAPELFAPSFYAAPSWSPDGRRIATPVRRTDTRETRLALIDVATGDVALLADSFALMSATAWPDRRGLVFVARSSRTEPTGGLGGQIWSQPMPEGSAVRLTTDVVDYRSVSASAGRSALVGVGMTNSAGLWIVPLGAGAPRRLPATLRTDALEGLAWIDRETLAFTSPVGGVPQVWTMRADGGDRRQVTAGGSHTWPRGSPDGRTIYLSATRGNQQGIWSLSRADGRFRLIAPTANATHLALGPDGRTIFFTAHADGTLSTWTVPAEGGIPVVFVKGLVGAVVSPDGQRVAGLWRPSPNESFRAAVFSIRGEGPSHVFDGPFGTEPMIGIWWASDGASLLYTTIERTDVWRRPLAGTPVRVTGVADGLIVKGDISPDGRSLAIRRGIPTRDAYLLKGF